MTNIVREIEFRGKRTDTKEWVYGYLCKTQHESECYSDFDGSHNKLFGIFNVVSIMVDDDDLNTYRVIPSTVGQFTGLHDKNGKEIYEGDIIDNLFQGIHQILLCEWTDNGFHFRDCKDGIDKRITMGEVIGNIHEGEKK